MPLSKNVTFPPAAVIRVSLLAVATLYLTCTLIPALIHERQSLSLSTVDENHRISSMTTIFNITLFNTTAKKCQNLSEIPDSEFKSQSQEDRELMKLFHDLCEGSYIEMGGLDGVLYSNSYVFNKALQWKGVIIELAKESYDKMVENRPNEIATVNAGVCDQPRVLHYVRGKGAVAGIWEFAAPGFKERWWKGLTLDSQNVDEVECDRLDNLLLEFAPGHTYFDFFSLDVEGAEFSVVQSIDWDRTGFGIIFVEADGHNEMKNLAMRKLIESNGYDFLKEHQRSYWFVNKNFHKIYEHLAY